MVVNMGKLTFSSSALAVRMLPYSHRWKPNLSAQLRTLEKQPSVCEATVKRTSCPQLWWTFVDKMSRRNFTIIRKSLHSHNLGLKMRILLCFFPADNFKCLEIIMSIVRNGRFLNLKNQGQPHFRLTETKAMEQGWINTPYLWHNIPLPILQPPYALSDPLGPSRT